MRMIEKLWRMRIEVVIASFCFGSAEFWRLRELRASLFLLFRCFVSVMFMMTDKLINITPYFLDVFIERMYTSQLNFAEVRKFYLTQMGGPVHVTGGQNFISNNI